MLSGIVGAVGGMFNTWMGNRKAKQEAKGRLEVAKLDAKANWETEAASGMRDSWKDEWFTVVFSLPLISILVSPFLDLAVGMYSGLPYVEGQLLTAGLASLSGLDGAPDWYTRILGVMVGASFGVKSITKGLKAYKSN